jgi:prolyl oligopeptidase
MRTFKILPAFLLFIACASQPAPPPPPSSAALPPPQTVASPVTETLHGVTITDPYQWLEDQQAPATRAWIDEQNAYTDVILGTRPESTFFAPRLEQLMTTDQFTTPVWRNGRAFFTRRKAGEDLYSIVMREGGTDRVLVDAAPLSADHTMSVGISDVATNGRMLAYFVRRGGADEIEVHFFDLDTLAEIGTPLAYARYYGIALSPDNHTVYFTRATPEGPRVYRRAISGTAEEKLFGDGYTKEKLLYTSLSDDGSYLLLHVLHGSSPKKTELYIDDLRDADGIRTIVNDLEFRSTAELAGDTIVIETNWNAPNRRVMTVSAANPGRENWKELIPENPKAAIQATSLAGGRIFVRYLEDVKPRVVAYDSDGVKRDEIAFDTLGAVTDIRGSWTSPVAFFSFSSFHVPPTIYQHDVASGQRSVFARQNVPLNPDDFVVEQLWYASKDGTRVPMFVVYKKGLARDGTHPTILTGYGGFTQSQLPSFRASVVAWVEQGGVFAVANLRGGGEYGEAWHRAGMLENKQNVFDDFIAAGEHLIRERFTSSEHLGISGGSNGGLLVMAVATQRPDLVNAVLCRYPLIDMIRYHKFLVAGFWVPEYGNAEEADDFRWIYDYSPYHHVKHGTAYPATLFITGDADTRVAPLHARKMTALLQASNGGDEPILLRYHTAGGHSSAGEPLRVQVRNAAEEYGFLWWQLR